MFSVEQIENGTVLRTWGVRKDHNFVAVIVERDARFLVCKNGVLRGSYASLPHAVAAMRRFYGV